MHLKRELKEDFFERIDYEIKSHASKKRIESERTVTVVKEVTKNACI